MNSVHCRKTPERGSKTQSDCFCTKVDLSCKRSALLVFWRWQCLLQSIVWPTPSPTTHPRLTYPAARFLCDSWATNCFWLQHGYELERCHGQRHRREACDISVSLRTRNMQTIQWWLQPATAGWRWTEQRYYQWLYRVSIKSTPPGLWLLLYQQCMSPVSPSWENTSMPNRPMDMETSEDHHRRS